MHLPQDLLDAVLDDWTQVELPARTRAGLRLLECQTLRPLELDAALLAELRAGGLDDFTLRETANIGIHFNFMNRLADAFDFDLPEPVGERRLVRMLDVVTRHLPLRFADPVWVRGADGRIRPTELERARVTMLEAAGPTTRLEREDAAAFVRAQWAPDLDAPSLSDARTRYLTKLALHAYRITEDELDALREEGMSTESIWELTLVAAFAAASVGVERLFELIYGDAGVGAADGASRKPAPSSAV